MQRHPQKIVIALILAGTIALLSCRGQSDGNPRDLQLKLVDGQIIAVLNDAPYTGTWKYKNIAVYYRNGIEIEKILCDESDNMIWSQERYINGRLAERERIDPVESIQKFITTADKKMVSQSQPYLKSMNMAEGYQEKMIVLDMMMENIADMRRNPSKYMTCILLTFSTVGPEDMELITKKQKTDWPIRKWGLRNH